MAAAKTSNPSLKRQLALSFKGVLDELGVKPAELGERTGWHRNLWSQRTAGQTEIKLEDIATAAKGLDVEPAWLAAKIFGGIDKTDTYTQILGELRAIKVQLGLISEY